MKPNETAAFQPTASLENLRLRAVLYRTIRRFFDERNFIETTTPFLSRDAVVDRFVEPISVEIPCCWNEKDDFIEKRFADAALSKRRSTTFYLQTSPEFAMKRLVAAGMNAIYQLAPACRRGDRGPFHNVEFSMLEWYRRGDDYRAGRRFLGEFVRTVAADFFEATSQTPQNWATRPVVERTFGDVFFEKTKLDPHSATCDDLKRFADASKIAYPESFLAPEKSATKDDWLDLIFSEVVQPTLGADAATLVFDYPASQSQLAKTRRETVVPNVARSKPNPVEIEITERFELFIEGIELANGYNELLDAEILRRRVRETSEERRRDGSPELPIESRLLQAMDAGLPTCAGCALGIDRFFMTLLGAKTIDEVLAFPIEIA